MARSRARSSRSGHRSAARRRCRAGSSTWISLIGRRCRTARVCARSRQAVGLIRVAVAGDGAEQLPGLAGDHRQRHLLGHGRRPAGESLRLVALVGTGAVERDVRGHHVDGRQVLGGGVRAEQTRAPRRPGPARRPPGRPPRVPTRAGCAAPRAGGGSRPLTWSSVSTVVSMRSTRPASASASSSCSRVFARPAGSSASSSHARSSTATADAAAPRVSARRPTSA